MEEIILLKMGETILKGLNRRTFESRFIKNLKSSLKRVGSFDVTISQSTVYVNPLEVIPGISGEAVTHRHALSQRPKWYTCACCPPNVARLISSFGKYAYSEKGGTAYCHMFASGEVTLESGMKFTCETDYPYAFDINFKIEKFIFLLN